MLPQRDTHFSRGESAQIVGGQLHVAADADLVDQAGHGHPAEFTPLGVGFVHVAAAFILHPGRAQLILDGLVDAAGGQAHGTGHVFAHAAVAAVGRVAEGAQMSASLPASAVSSALLPKARMTRCVSKGWPRRWRGHSSEQLRHWIQAEAARRRMKLRGVVAFRCR